MRLSTTIFALAFALGVLPTLAKTVQAAPKTVVTIKPVHSLVAGVMAGIAEPTLLIDGAGSPHDHALKPSEARALAAADLVVWVGPEIEGFFIKPAKSLAKDTVVLTLLERSELTRLPARQGGAWSRHRHDDHDEKHGDEKHGDEKHRKHEDKHGHGEADDDFDAHVWLDPANARAIVEVLAETLASMDPDNAAAYRANANRMSHELKAMEREIAGLIAPSRGTPYVVFHDAYQYFEARFGMNAVGSISVSPDRRPSARRLVEIRHRIVEAGAECIFTEPQFPPRLAETAREGTPARLGVLDPLGVETKAGPSAYGEMMRGLALGLAACLEG
jgi:zinc transport system substrate-binding protein